MTPERIPYKLLKYKPTRRKNKRTTDEMLERSVLNSTIPEDRRGLLV
jgi:hypothetical protein